MERKNQPEHPRAHSGHAARLWEGDNTILNMMAASDARWLVSRGIPAVVLFGPAGGNGHDDSEGVDLRQVEQFLPRPGAALPGKLS